MLKQSPRLPRPKVKSLELKNYYAFGKPVLSPVSGQVVRVLSYLLDWKLTHTDGYFPIKISFGGIGSDNYKSEAAFIDATADLNTITAHDAWFTQLIALIDKKVVLMIDEVDKSSNNQLFLDFLGMLREKFI